MGWSKRDEIGSPEATDCLLRLKPGNDGVLHDEHLYLNNKRASRSPLSNLWLYLSLGCNLFLLATSCGFGALWFQHTTSTTTSDPSIGIFSPANSEVEWIPHKFNRSRGTDKSPFQGWPSDDLDKQWADQYVPGLLTTVDAETARKFPDRTARLPWPGRENEFMFTLDVFHQMHCLDIVRKAMYRGLYKEHFYFENGTVDYCKWLHADHCLDQVRQALMCQADVSVVHYAWSHTVEGMRPRVDNWHTCRNYDKLLHWARQRAVPGEQWHSSRHVVEGVDGTYTIEQGRNQALEDQNDGECNAI